MASMDRSILQVRRIGPSDEPVLRTLLGYYCHDMAEWFEFDTREDGTYSYSISDLWEAECGVHLAYMEQIPVGFALVGQTPDPIEYPGARDLREFFVVRRHRRSGVGRLLATIVWNEYPGPWLVRVFHGNRPALPFWRATINAYTHDRFLEKVRSVSDRDWSYFSFESRGPRT